MTVFLFLYCSEGLLAQQGSTSITIAVHNYSNASADDLAKAEGEAHRVFEKIGVQTSWLNCSSELQRDRNDPAGCSLVDGAHLVLNVIHTVKNPEFDGIDVLGSAYVIPNRTSYYAYAYFGRIRQLTARFHLGGGLLAAVFVHEIGHLLLRSSAHSVSGIMSANWDANSLQRISCGTVYFIPEEAKRMRNLVAQLEPAKGIPTALSASTQ